MFGSLLLIPILATSLPEWRSQEFLKARAEVDKMRQAKDGIGVIIEIKRTSPTTVKGVAEVRGHGSWVLSWAPKVELPNQTKPEAIIKWSLDGSFALTRPIPIEFAVPRNTTEGTFILNTNDLGSLEWHKALPASSDTSVVIVFYIPQR